MYNKNKKNSQSRPIEHECGRRRSAATTFGLCLISGKPFALKLLLLSLNDIRTSFAFESIVTSSSSEPLTVPGMLDFYFNQGSTETNTLKENGLLNTIATVLSHRTARDFIFGTHTRHIQELISPNVTSRSSVYSCDKTIIDATPNSSSLTPSPAPYFNVSGDHVFIPVFASDELFVGVGVCDGTFAYPQNVLQRQALQERRWFHFRFAFDLNSRVLLIVYVEDEHLFRVIVKRAISTTVTGYGIGVFHRKTFLRAIEKESIQERDLYSTSILLEGVLFPHACSVCNKQPLSDCTCTVGRFQPSHSRDHEAFFKNAQFMTFTAKNTGSRERRKFDGGRVERRLDVSEFLISCRQVRDADLLKRLCSLALRNLLHVGGASPRESQLLLSTTQPSSAGRDAFDIRQEYDAVSYPVSTTSATFEMAVGNPSNPGPSQPILEQAPTQTNELLLFPEEVQPEQYDEAEEKDNSSEEESLETEAHAQQKEETETPAATPAPIDYENMTPEERRKERNRQSARRSHRRYAEFRKKLESDLEEAQEREKALRKMDHELRVENLALRREWSRRSGYESALPLIEGTHPAHREIG